MHIDLDNREIIGVFADPNLTERPSMTYADVYK